MSGLRIKERLDVERLVTWALIDNGLGAEFVEKAGRLDWRDWGTRIQAGSGGWAVSGPRVQHDDAIRIAQTIAALPPDPETGEAVMPELVIRHGRTNCRPDWCEEGVGRSEIKVNRRGQAEWHYERPGDRKSRKLEPKRIWVGETQDRVDWYRARYSAWWLALEALVAPLNAVLERFEATGPRAPREPWNGVRVFGPDGEDRTGMIRGGASAKRRAMLAADGPIDLPATIVPVIHSAESAGR